MCFDLRITLDFEALNLRCAYLSKYHNSYRKFRAPLSCILVLLDNRMSEERHVLLIFHQLCVTNLRNSCNSFFSF